MSINNGNKRCTVSLFKERTDYSGGRGSIIQLNKNNKSISSFHNLTEQWHLLDREREREGKLFVLFFILNKIYSALPYFRVYMSYIYIYNIPLHLFIFFWLFAGCVFFFLQGCNTALIERCAGGDGLVDRERDYVFFFGRV